MRFPGTVSVSEEIFGAVARDVALSAIAAGFKNVALMVIMVAGNKHLKKSLRPSMQSGQRKVSMSITSLTFTIKRKSK